MTKWVFTCEHAACRIPVCYKELFDNSKEVLVSHRGTDIGIYPVFRELAAHFADYSLAGQYSRLLIDLNRAPGSRNLFSSYTKTLAKNDRQQIIDEYYTPYRNAVEQTIAEFIRTGSEVIHISFHSFTPVLAGKTRTCDIGLLYDPGQVKEKLLSKEWQRILSTLQCNWKVKRNYPYRGKADGFTCWLRRQFAYHYTGIELEINQKHLPDKKSVSKLLAEVLELLKTRVSQ